MFGQVTPRSFLWLVSTFAVLSIGIIGCGGDGDEDDNDWGGTWRLETVDGQSWDQALEEEFGEEANVSIVTNNWTFNSDGTVDVEFAIKFEVKEEGLAISGEGSMTMKGTYSLSGSNYTRTLTEGEGTGIFSELEGPLGEEEETGTWSRKGNTLTLNSDDGTVYVYKKK